MANDASEYLPTPTPSLDRLPPRLAAILDLIGPAVLLPVTPGTKKPSFDAWQKTTLEDTSRPEYLKRFGPQHNIGVLQGKPSRGLCSIDLDHDELLEPFLDANPKLAGTLRTRRSRGCNLWVRIIGDYPDLQKLHRPAQVGKAAEVGEWRSTGGQTVISGEAEGVAYQFEVEARPVEIPFGEIVWPASFIADPPQLAEVASSAATANADSGRLDEAKLENVQRLAGGSIRAACPACRLDGGDHTGDHLLIEPSGKFGCAKYPGDGEHRKQIWKLAGARSVCVAMHGDGESELEFARRLAAALPPVKTVGNAWHLYRNGTWQPFNRDTLKPQALAILPEAIRTIRRANTLLEHVEAEHQTNPEAFRGFHLFASNGDVLLNARNGLVRVAPGSIELLPHSPDHAFTRQTAAPFNPDATAPLFERVLSEVLPDPEDRGLFQLCLGNFLFPDCRFETALCCYGEAGRGKSTVADPVYAALGADLVCRLSMSQVCDPRSYHLPDMRFAAVNLGTELTTADIAESGNFKTLVSGEPIEARSIYGKPFKMQTACKLWFLANSLPRFRHGTEAELRRTRFLRFDYQPPVKDVTLKARLAGEADGVFLFMVRGLQQLLACQEIPLGGAESRAVHDRFRVSNDPVGAFVQFRCDLSREARTPKEDLRAAFTEFAGRHELPTVCGEWFFRALFERFPSLRETQPRVAGERLRCIQGIALRSYASLTTA